MLKKAVFFIALLVVVGLVVWFMGVRELFSSSAGHDSIDSQTAPTSLKQSFNNQQAAAQTPNDALDLSIDSIDLFQGEGGLEIWRLTARWGNIRKEDGIIIVDQPELNYFLSEADGYIFVDAKSGEVDQSQQILRFLDNVRLSHEDRKMTGSVLVYDGKQHTMTFPQASQFFSSNMTGSADSVSWDLKNQEITAAGHVLVHLGSL